VEVPANKRVNCRAVVRSRCAKRFEFRLYCGCKDRNGYKESLSLLVDSVQQICGEEAWLQKRAEDGADSPRGVVDALRRICWTYASEMGGDRDELGRVGTTG
jgi:hypothetical protein